MNHILKKRELDCMSYIRSKIPDFDMIVENFQDLIRDFYDDNNCPMNTYSTVRCQFLSTFSGIEHSWISIVEYKTSAHALPQIEFVHPYLDKMKDKPLRISISVHNLRRSSISILEDLFLGLESRVDVTGKFSENTGSVTWNFRIDKQNQEK